jgi:hypothetical protein
MRLIWKKYDSAFDPVVALVGLGYFVGGAYVLIVMRHALGRWLPWLLAPIPAAFMMMGIVVIVREWQLWSKMRRDPPLSTPADVARVSAKQDANRMNWLMLVYGAAGTFVVSAPMLAYWSGIGWYLFTLVSTPVISLVLLLVVTFCKTPRRRQSTALLLLGYVAVTAALWKNYDELRPQLRWLLWSHRFKAELAAAPNPAKGDLKHIEWDGFGGAGSDTTAYLVLDPTDSLSTAAKRHEPGKFPGIPCEVPVVRRLERQWYSVVYYTNADWEHCP